MKGVHAMANVAKSRKEDITRTERKEAKGVIQAIRKKNASLRRLVAELRTRVFLHERENKRLKTTIREFQVGSAHQPNGKSSKAR
jgi:hypothetical protein